MVDGRDDWRQIHDRLAPRPLDELSPDELDELADALFWLNEPWRGVEVRRAAHGRWLDAGNPERAARSAWHVFYEHWLVGEAAVARGWLGRARNLVFEPGSATAGWVALAESDVATAAGRADEAREQAQRARALGRATGDHDLLAMGLQAEGRCLVGEGRLEDGLACLDEAMVAVIGNELAPLFTGWIYCNVISTCHAVGDLRRANEWVEAALRWSRTVRDGRLYPGLCRVYSAELAQLRGEWGAAERDARQACDDLLAFDRRYAGAAHYVVGELCRLQGRLDEAARYFTRSHELGHDPQPGLALLQAAQGHLDEALGALRPTLRASEPLLVRLPRLLAVIDLADRAGDTETLMAAVERIEAATAGSTVEVAQAYALAAQGHRAVAAGTPAAALAPLRRAVTILVDLGLPYDAARCRLVLARAAATTGDALTADLERAAAEAALDRLGAVIPGEALAPEGLDPDGLLSARELEVLGLVAQGLTNRQVGDRLHLSRHTVARHLSNVFTKLDVQSRTAAVTIATGRGLLRRPDGQD